MSADGQVWNRDPAPVVDAGVHLPVSATGDGGRRVDGDLQKPAQRVEYAGRRTGKSGTPPAGARQVIHVHIGVIVEHGAISGGWIALEIDAGQGGDCKRIFSDAGDAAGDGEAG